MVYRSNERALDFLENVIKIQLEFDFFKVLVVKMVSEFIEKFMRLVIDHPFLWDTVQCLMNCALIEVFAK